MAPSQRVRSFFKPLVDDDFSWHWSPSGESWTIGLERREDGQFFFRKGWRHFMKDHLLEIGTFLVFEYDGDSKFDVTIHHPTGCEKEESASYKPTDVKEASDGCIVFRSKYTSFEASVPKNPYRMVSTFFEASVQKRHFSGVTCHYEEVKLGLLASL